MHLSISRLSVALIVAGVLTMLTPVVAEAGPRTGARWPSSTVYVENHAGARWPVRKAAENLDNGSALNLVVVQRCPAGNPCIRVYDVASLSGSRVGVERSTSLDGRLYSSNVSLSNAWGREASRRQRLKVVCHELGHAVGLEHSAHRRGTCMRIGQAHLKPTLSRSDRRALDRLYRNR